MRSHVQPLFHSVTKHEHRELRAGCLVNHVRNQSRLPRHERVVFQPVLKLILDVVVAPLGYQELPKLDRFDNGAVLLIGVEL